MFSLLKIFRFLIFLFYQEFSFVSFFLFFFSPQTWLWITHRWTCAKGYKQGLLYTFVNKFGQSNLDLLSLFSDAKSTYEVTALNYSKKVWFHFSGRWVIATNNYKILSLERFNFGLEWKDVWFCNKLVLYTHCKQLPDWSLTSNSLSCENIIKLHFHIIPKFILQCFS